MTDNIIKLEKDNILRLKIVTYDGKETGEVLEFDFDDMELPLKYQELLEKDKKNKEHFYNKVAIIQKRKDVKGKKAMSRNEEDINRALCEFIKKEEEIYNMFLGENGVKKLLNGRKLGWTTLPYIDKIISEQISPYINKMMNKITDDIKSKYGMNNIKDNDNIEVIK